MSRTGGVRCSIRARGIGARGYGTLHVSATLLNQDGLEVGRRRGPDQSAYMLVGLLTTRRRIG